MKKNSDKLSILIANGVNLDLLGIREPDIYGLATLEDINAELEKFASGSQTKLGLKACSLNFFQTNSEEKFLEELSQPWDGAVINPAAWTHTSLALGDRLSALKLPFVEVHLSNLARREDFRQQSYSAPYALGVVSGMGVDSYVAGLFALLRHLSKLPKC